MVRGRNHSGSEHDDAFDEITAAATPSCPSSCSHPILGQQQPVHHSHICHAEGDKTRNSSKLGSAGVTASRTIWLSGGSAAKNFPRFTPTACLRSNSSISCIARIIEADGPLLFSPMMSFPSYTLDCGRNKQTTRSAEMWRRTVLLASLVVMLLCIVATTQDSSPSSNTEVPSRTPGPDDRLSLAEQHCNTAAAHSGPRPTPNLPNAVQRRPGLISRPPGSSRTPRPLRRPR